MTDGLFPHIILGNIAKSEPFARPGTGGSKKFPSVMENREAHAQHLLRELRASHAASAEAIARRANILPETQNGVYLTIQGRPNEPLLTERLERRSKKIELLSVRQEGNHTKATVFIPETATDFLQKTVEDYRTKDEPRATETEAKHRRLIEGIGEDQASCLRDLWMDAPSQFPDPDIVDWLGGVAAARNIRSVPCSSIARRS